MLSRGRISVAKRESLSTSTARSGTTSQKMSCYSRTRSYSLKLCGLRSILVKVNYRCKSAVKVLTNNQRSLTFSKISRPNNGQLRSDCRLQRRTALELLSTHLARWPDRLQDILRSGRHIRLRCDEVFVRDQWKRNGVGRGKVRVTEHEECMSH